VKAKLFSALGIVLAFSLILSACSGKSSNGEPLPTSRTFNPTVKTEFEIDDWAWADRADQVISPDGKYALLILNNESGQSVAVTPIGGEEHAPVALYSSPMGSVDGLYYRTLGWTEAGKALFAAFGYQNQGPNTGKRGISVLSGDIVEGTATELAFVDLPEGQLHTAEYIPERGKVYLTMTGAVWAYDLNENRLSQIRVGLPTYDGLFYARISPDGNHFVYELLEDGKSGVYILEASSGVEKPLLPNGDTMSFIPQWSPDGKYVAAYTVDRKAGETGTARADYAFFPGEDGPLTIAPKITVMDTSGNVVCSVSLDGKVLSNFRWSNDSKSLVFVSGEATMDSATYMDMGMPCIPWDGVWTVSATGNELPVRLAALEPPASDEPSFIYPLAFDADNKSVYYQFSQGESLWVALAKSGAGASTETPLHSTKIADGYWHFQSENPVFGEYTAALITTGQVTDLWFLKSSELRKMDSWGTITTVILGYNDDLLLLFRKGEEGPATLTVVSVFDE
jgi:hypothetical protein